MKGTWALLHSKDLWSSITGHAGPDYGDNTLIAASAIKLKENYVVVVVVVVVVCGVQTLKRSGFQSWGEREKPMKKKQKYCFKPQWAEAHLYSAPFRALSRCYQPVCGGGRGRGVTGPKALIGRRLTLGNWVCWLELQQGRGSLTDRCCSSRRVSECPSHPLGAGGSGAPTGCRLIY